MTAAGEAVKPQVVVAIDGSPGSDAAADWAQDYAAATGGSLRLVIAWEWPACYGVTVVPEGLTPAQDAERVVTRTADRLSLPGDPVSVSVIEGRPGPVLADASRDADLLVVGRRGHSAATELIIGSVSAACIHHAHCPVVVVPRGA
jgi:nucleotide-binding universal stress UspA family protein